MLPASSMLANLFYYSRQDQYTDAMFAEMWTYDKHRFLNIAFYLRRHRYTQSYTNTPIYDRGRGERNIFYQILRWLSIFHLPELIAVMPYIPDNGYWKDLLVLMGTPAEPAVISLFGDQLERDYASYTSSVPGSISLAAKWTPNENSSSDRRHQTFKKIVAYMNISCKQLRTKYLVPLRRYLVVVEQQISDRNWSRINYDHLSSTSLKFHEHHFLQHDRDRYLAHMLNKDQHRSYLLPKQVQQALHTKRLNPNDFLERDLKIPVAIGISGAMHGLPLAIGACLCLELGNKRWIPYIPEAGIELSNTCDIHGTGEGYIADLFPIDGVIGSNLVGCLRSVAHGQLIVVTEYALTEEEIKTIVIPEGLHLTYWVVNLRPVHIRDYDQLTVVEGYDINIYQQLVLVGSVTRASYMNLFIPTFSLQSTPAS